MLQPGTILLEKYRVERVLGKGGMGIVVAARHVQLEELFAIKMILPEAVEQPEALERFLREARACAKLKGEHVARVHDIGKLPNGMPYMLMEHLSGEDLGDLLTRRGALPLEEAALYVYQACEAISEAHANGIVHRDLKPSNLFLTHRPNGSPCIKVLDFGISKELDPNNKAGKNLTKTGSFLGSPMYMPPEQMVDIKNTDSRGDVWALGVLLYELVTGEPPFLAEAVTSVITKVLLHHPEPPSRVRPGIPPEVDTIVMRCLEKQPEKRYSTAQELKDALESFVVPLVAPSILEKSLSISRSQLLSGSNLSEVVIPAARGSRQGPLEPTISPMSALAETVPGDLEWNGPAKTISMSDGVIATDNLAANLQQSGESNSVGEPPARAASEEFASAFIAIDAARAQSAKSQRTKYMGWIFGGLVVAAFAMGFLLQYGRGVEEPGTGGFSDVASTAAPKDSISEQAPANTVNQQSPTVNRGPEVRPTNDPQATSISPSLQSSASKPQSTVSRPVPTTTSKRTSGKKAKVPGYDD